MATTATVTTTSTERSEVKRVRWFVLSVTLAALVGCQEQRTGIPLDPPTERSSPSPEAHAARTAEAHGASTWSGLVDRSPGVAAARMRARAAGIAVGSTGLLPDPTVSVQAMRMIAPDERRTDPGISIEQDLPRWGERSSARAIAQADAAAAIADYGQAWSMTMAQVARLAADAGLWSRRVVAYDELAERSTTILSVFEAGIATGGASRLEDRVALQGRIDAAAIAATAARTEADNALGELRSVLGLAENAPLPQASFPPPTTPTESADPRVAAAKAEMLRAQAERALARSQRYPVTGLGVGYQRDGREDEYGVVFRFSVPLQQRALARAEDAASGRARAAQTSIDGAVRAAHETRRRAERTRALADAARTRGEQTIARLRADLDAVVRAAAAARPDTMVSLLDRLDRITEVTLSVIDQEQSAAQAEADLWLLATPSSATVPQGQTP